MSLSHTDVPAQAAVAESAAVLDVLVLGAGPAGLSVGHELKTRGVSFLILERGEAAGESWRRMPTNLKLVSPWKSNFLPGTAPARLPGNYEMSRAEYCDYLASYAKEQQLPVKSGVTVTTVERDHDGVFLVRSSGGDFRARCLVNATGGSSKAFIPKFDGAEDSTIPQLHVADYRDPAQVKRLVGERTGPVLIVGKRLSAGQVLVDLVDAGIDVVLSHRSKIRFGGGALMKWLNFRMLPVIEAIKINFLGQATCGFEVTMDGGQARQLIRSGKVRTYPDVNRLQGNSVLFKDGTRLKPSLVLFATGFRPTLDHLHSLLVDVPDRRRLPPLDGMESAFIPGLFFIGLENQRNLRSHYLRGIREDAAVVAEEVGLRLAWLARKSSASASPSKVA